MVRKTVFFIVLFLLLITIFFKYYVAESLTSPQGIEGINLESINKLMIVAHPDDEVIWGGSHLIEDNYLVVCITCGSNHVRNNEFINVMKETDDSYIMLGYPDKIGQKRSDWENEKDKIREDLKKIILYKNWDLIVTHNPKGEYGHQQHTITSNIVTDIYDKDTNKQSSLYYFGKYYSKNYLKSHSIQDPTISNASYKLKKEILTIYVSQKFINTSFDQMFKYENWINSKDWS